MGCLLLLKKAALLSVRTIFYCLSRHRYPEECSPPHPYALHDSRLAALQMPPRRRPGLAQCGNNRACMTQLYASVFASASQIS